MKKSLLSLAILALSLTAVYSQKHVTKPATVGDGSFFSITIDHNGDKTEFLSTQFEDYTGIVLSNDSSHKLSLEARGQNEKANENRYWFSGSLVNDTKGVFELGKGDGTNFLFESTKSPQLVCNEGSYDITAMPLKGGLAQGTFTAHCKGPSANGEGLDPYTLTGSFKLNRM